MAHGIDHASNLGLVLMNHRVTNAFQPRALMVPRCFAPLSRAERICVTFSFVMIYLTAPGDALRNR